MIEIFSFASLIAGIRFLLLAEELGNPSLKILGGMLIIFGLATAFSIMHGQK